MDSMGTREFNEYVYALSQLSHIHENAPTRPPNMRQEDRNHLRILDGIALLPVSEAKGDVTAVTFRQGTDSIDLVYAKNSPCDGALHSHIEGILGYILESQNLELGLLTGGICIQVVERSCEG